MKLFFFVFFIFLAVACREHGQNQKNIVEKTFKRVFRGESNIPSFDSIVFYRDAMFEDSIFQHFYKNDVSKINLYMESLFDKFTEGKLIDSALNCIYPKDFIFDENARYKVRDFGLNMLVIGMKKGIGDAYGHFADFLKYAYMESSFSGNSPEENQQKYEQYMLKSTKLNSVFGWRLLADYYSENGKIEEMISIYEHFDKKGDVESTIFLWEHYKSISDSLYAHHYMEKLVKYNIPEAVYMKATKIAQKGDTATSFKMHIRLLDSLNKTDLEMLDRLGMMDNDFESLSKAYGDKWRDIRDKYKPFQ